MNNQELKNFRKDFHDNLELGFHEKHKLSFKDYEKILKKTIKNTVVSDESSKEIYVYMGSYGMINGTMAPICINDKTVLFRRYKDIETAREVQVHKDDIKVFESLNRVIFAPVDEITEEGYDESFNRVQYLYFKELLHSNEIDAYKLIKRLTPSK